MNLSNAEVYNVNSEHIHKHEAHTK